MSSGASRPDAAGPTVALSGELGSGKSSVSELLATALGARRVSTGEAQRRIAAARGITTLELNQLSETDPSIDEEIDSVFRSLATVPEALVVDSRLAWHFLPRAYKVHLVVDPVESLRRVLGRGGTAVERYGSFDEAMEQLGERVESERRRFLAVYGVDIFDLRNYDLVVDTTTASPEQVCTAILDRLAGASDPARVRPALLVDPARVRDPGPTGGTEATPGPLVITVAYDRPTFMLVGGHAALVAARDAGEPLVPAALVD